MSPLFFLVSLAKGLLVVIFLRPTLSFIELFYCFPLLSFCSDLYYFLSSAKLVLVCSFSISLRCKFREVILDLSFFNVDIYHYQPPSWVCFSESYVSIYCTPHPRLFLIHFFLLLFKNMLFYFHIFVVFSVFLLLLISSFRPFCQKNMLDMISVF